MALGAGNGASQWQGVPSTSDHVEDDDLLATNAGVTEGDDIGGHRMIVVRICAAGLLRAAAMAAHPADRADQSSSATGGSLMRYPRASQQE